MHITDQEIQDVMSKLRAVRAIGDLMMAASDTLKHERYELGEETLAELGEHLEALATEALVILKYEDAKDKPRAAEAGG